MVRKTHKEFCFVPPIVQRRKAFPDCGIAHREQDLNSQERVSFFKNFLSNPGLWIGLAVAAIFLATAVRLRRYQGPV